MAYIRIKNLKKEYHVTRTETQEVLKGIDINFQKGDFVALLGESGCGKSTFLNILAGLDFDYTGSIVVAGKFMRDYSERELDIHRKNKVGIIFQNFNLIKQMTAFENVMLPLALTKLSPDERNARATELLEQVGLKDHMNKKPNQLSGGQKQRVAIARALANNPTILLADEPTGNLDAQSTDEILEILKKIAKGGKLVICVTHSEKVAANCTRVIKMDDGNIKHDTQEKENYKEVKEDEKPTEIKDNIDKKEIFKFAKNNLFANLKRNILVTTALSIGICAFVLMFFLSAGMKTYVENELSTGMNKHQINVYKTSASADALIDTSETLGTSDITFFDILGVGKVHEASTIQNFGVSYGSNKILSVATVYDGWTAKTLWGDTSGKGMSDGEIIISSSMFERLVEAGTIGKDTDGDVTDAMIRSATVTLSSTVTNQTGTLSNIKIRGIIDDSASFDTAYITLGAMKTLRNNNTHINMVYLIANKVSDISGIINDLEEFGFYAYQPDSFAADILSYIDLFSLVLSLVSIVALVVSAIMIFIVMYISVIERTKEIGILRSLGTRRRDVKRIFIAEAGIIGLTAGVAGSLLAVIIGLFTNLGVGGWVISLNPLFILLGIVTSFLVSMLSSLAPSSSGSSLDPIEALRLND